MAPHVHFVALSAALPASPHLADDRVGLCARLLELVWPLEGGGAPPPGRGACRGALEGGGGEGGPGAALPGGGRGLWASAARGERGGVASPGARGGPGGGRAQGGAGVAGVDAGARRARGRGARAERAPGAQRRAGGGDPHAFLVWRV